MRHLDPNRYKFASAPHWESFGDGKDGGETIVTDQCDSDGVDPSVSIATMYILEGLAVMMEQ